MKCLDCNTELTEEQIKDIDYCPNCERLWFEGKSNRYGNTIGITKICNCCNLEKDLINFRKMFNSNGNSYYLNKCQPCYLISRRNKNKYKSHQRPHFYLQLDEKTAAIKIKNDYVLFDLVDFEKIKQYIWILFKRQRDKTKYCHCISKNRDFTRIHHLIFGKPALGFKVDHINHNGLDNRKENLRFSDNSQNICNSKLRKNNTSGYKGVSKPTKNSLKWVAKIEKNYKAINLGAFDSLEEAARIYDIAAIKYHGEFACTNFPIENYKDIVKINACKAKDQNVPDNKEVKI